MSEIERGTCDLPTSTLQTIVEDGLGLKLGVRFLPKSSLARPAMRKHLRRAVDEIAELIAELPTEQRGEILIALQTARESVRR